MQNIVCGFLDRCIRCFRIQWNQSPRQILYGEAVIIASGAAQIIHWTQYITHARVCMCILHGFQYYDFSTRVSTVCVCVCSMLRWAKLFGKYVRSTPCVCVCAYYLWIFAVYILSRGSLDACFLCVDPVLMTSATSATRNFAWHAIAFR